MQHFIHKRVLEHCKKQKGASVRSIDGNKEGAYLASNGNKCLVGIFITKDNYDKSLEGKGLSTCGNVLSAVEWSIKRELNKKEINFLSACQNIHDDCITYNGGNLNSKFIRERINEAADKFLYNR